MARPTKLGLIALGLGAMHVLPARHHLTDFLAAPSPADAWKGFGAAVAVMFLLLPMGVQARIVRKAWKPVLLTIAAAHLVPALDHIPKLLAAPSWADAWRGIGATVAVMWFVLPRAVQLEVVRLLVAKGDVVAFRHVRQGQDASLSPQTIQA